MNERELIELCLKKDKKAWGLFVQKYSGLVYWAIGKRLAASNFKRGESEVEDIFQEVFLSVLKGNNLTQIKDPKFIPGWLAMVASHKTVDFMRREINRQEELTFDGQVFQSNAFVRDIAGREISYVVGEVINTLSDKERVIISLNLLRERTHREISQIVGAPINTVSTVIARAKEKLRKELQKREIADYL